MKIRTGFVSNSSSSSFTCGYCNQTASGWDLGLSEAGMKACENGHVFCESHGIAAEVDREARVRAALKKHINGAREWLAERAKKALEDLDSAPESELEAEIELLEDYWFEGEVPKETCPLCMMQAITQSDMVDYLCWKLGVREDNVINLFREDFSSYEDFRSKMKEYK